MRCQSPHPIGKLNAIFYNFLNALYFFCFPKILIFFQFLNFFTKDFFYNFRKFKLKEVKQFKCSTSFDEQSADVVAVDVKFHLHVDADDVQHMNRNLMVADDVVDVIQVHYCATLMPVQAFVPEDEVLPTNLAKIVN